MIFFAVNLELHSCSKLAKGPYLLHTRQRLEGRGYPLDGPPNLAEPCLRWFQVFSLAGICLIGIVGSLSIPILA